MGNMRRPISESREGEREREIWIRNRGEGRDRGGEGRKRGIGEDRGFRTRRGRGG